MCCVYVCMCVCVCEKERETDREREKSETEVTYPNRNLKSQVIKEIPSRGLSIACVLSH